MKILIVDDSDTEAALLRYLFESESDMTVVGIAKNGREAVRLNEQLKPDMITMDILMPLMDGFEATSLIMSQQPTPIVVISSGVRDESLNVTFKALEAGALSVIEKPSRVFPDSGQSFNNIVDTVRAMADIKVIKRRFNTHRVKPIKPSIEHRSTRFEIVAIGTSVGGPAALKVVLSTLPLDFPVPIVIVQHMTPGFIDGFATWLDANTALTVRTAGEGDVLLPKTVYFAPDKHHLEVRRGSRRGELVGRLTTAPPVSGFRPSATVLLNSVSAACGKNAVGVLLTGMGSDGAQGLLAMKEAHAHTLIQDKESAVVFGMAGVAQSIGAVDRVVTLDSMGEYLTAIVYGNRK